MSTHTHTPRLLACAAGGKLATFGVGFWLRSQGPGPLGQGLGPTSMGPCTCPRLLDPRRRPGYLGPGPLAWVLWPWPGPTWSESLGLSAWPGSLAEGLQRPRWARGQGPLGQALEGPRMHTGANRHTQDRCVTSVISSPVCPRPCKQHVAF